jgi:hypothetical protein
MMVLLTMPPVLIQIGGPVTAHCPPGVYGVQPAEEFRQAVSAEFALWPVLLRQLGIRLE